MTDLRKRQQRLQERLHPNGANVTLDLSVGDVHVATTETSESVRTETRDVAIVIVRDDMGRVLTVSRTEAPQQQALPGGHVEENESAANGAIREAYEECGIRCFDLWEIAKLPLRGDKKARLYVFEAGRWEGLPMPGELGRDRLVAWLTPVELYDQSSGECREVLDTLKKDYAWAVGLRSMTIHHVGTRPSTLREISTQRRQALPDSSFALPKLRKYPLNDACLHGDTLVDIVGGEPTCIRDLVGQSVQILGYDAQAEAVVEATATEIRLTMRLADVVRVVLDNGADVVCTPDHRFMLRDASYREAGELVPGDSLMPCDVASFIGYTPEYDEGLRSREGVAKYARRQAETPRAGSPISREAPRDVAPRGTQVQTDESRAGACEGSRGGSQASRGHSGQPDKADSLQGEAAGAQGSRSRAPATVEVRTVRGGRPEDRLGSLPRARALPRVDLRSVQQGAGPDEGLRDLAGQDGRVSASPSLNHRVVRVEPAGRGDVYDMTVEGLHNFGLSAGVFVHNSHVRNAAARLEQMHKAGKINDADYHVARGRIASAAKKFGIESEYNEAAKKEEAKDKAPRLEVSIDHPQHGHFEIRHMKDGSHRFYGRVDLEADAADGDEPKWVHIATRGHFEGHRAGSFDLNDQVFSEIARNYSDVDGGEVSFDFEHASEADGSEGSIPQEGAPAQGWIKGLKVAERGLYALVEWLEPAKSYIRGKKYKYVSPAIRFGARHPVTNAPIGARLTSVALTNQPFLRHLEPLAAKDKAHDGTNKPSPNSHPNDNLLGRMMSDGKTYAYGAHEFMPKIKACLGMHELSTPAECGARLKSLRELHQAGSGDGIDGVHVAEYIDRLRDAMQPPMNATVEELLDCVEEMIEAAIADHEARMHPEATLDGGSPLRAADDDEAMRAAKAAKDTTMTDPNQATTLKDISAKLSAAETEKANLTLTLKERESVILAKDVEIATLKDTNIKLVAEMAKRDEADVVARVDTAFDYYGAKHNLTAEDKELMIVACKADRAKFEKRYPTPVDKSGKRVPPYMLKSLGEGRTDPPITTEAGAEPVAPAGALSLPQLTLKIMQEEKICMADAQEKAIKLRARGAA